MSNLTESTFENALIDFMRNNLGYEYEYGCNIERDYHEILYIDVLRESLRRINRKISNAAIEEAVFTLKNRLSGSLIQRNQEFNKYLQEGLTVSIQNNDKTEYPLIKLVDFDNVDNNNFLVINQWTIVEKDTKRPDVIIFINGIPLVVMELKSCTRASVDASDAYKQLQVYKKVIPSLFQYNAFCIISDMITTRAGTITANESRFMEWKTVDGITINDKPDFKVLFEGMLEKHRLLDIIHNFLMFEENGAETSKILAAYHQYYAVKKALVSVTSAIENRTRKGGVFWHTQGSGKSFSMLFLTHLLRKQLPNSTIVVLTDRNDLDGQLYRQFAKCKEYLREEPLQAQSGGDLSEKLSNTYYGGIFFSTVQKFEETEEPFSLRENIIVMADEAHRSQYGLDENFDVDTLKMKKGFARLIRDAIPNATFIGFTGTPINIKDHSTEEVFGECIDVYDMTQSVNDGATRPVYYENRVVKLNLNQHTLDEIDKCFDELVAESEPKYGVAINESRKKAASMEAILGAPETLDALSLDLVKHYEERQNLLTGKAMIVAPTRKIAVEIYERIMKLRPDWSEKVKIVMTISNQDPPEWFDYAGSRDYKEELAKKFKDDNAPMKIAIVVDMWLTGFDVPSLSTMYLYKPMSGHNLMQAIARVNRVFKDKEGGLVVDYVGIANALKEAMKQYSKRDNDRYGDTDIAKTALVSFRDKLDLLIKFFHGFNIGPYITGADSEKASTFLEGLNFLTGRKLDDQSLFLDLAYQLRQAKSLCQSMLSRIERGYADFFENERIALDKLINPQSSQEGSDRKQKLTDRIRNLIAQSVEADGVINIFEDKKTEISIFDKKFLTEVANMKQKNLSAELLRRLLQDKIHQYKRTNIVKSITFSEKMNELMNSWNNSLISNIEVIEELLKLANEIKAEVDKAKELDLSEEELAFYDALTKPQAVKDFYENEELVQLTKELTETLRKNRTIDWSKKERSRAKMRMMVKKLLKKYKYPPEDADDALATVLKQCELWADNIAE